MADAILHSAPTRMTLADSRNNVATIQTLLEAAGIGQLFVYNNLVLVMRCGCN
jgi:hypothetical protein